MLCVSKKDKSVRRLSLGTKLDRMEERTAIDDDGDEVSASKLARRGGGGGERRAESFDTLLIDSVGLGFSRRCLILDSFPVICVSRKYLKTFYAFPLGTLILNWRHQQFALPPTTGRKHKKSGSFAGGLPFFGSMTRQSSADDIEGE